MKNAVFFLIMIPFVGLNAQQNEALFLIKPYLQYSTKTSIRILWETKEEASSTVEYGEAVIGAKSPQLHQKVSLAGNRVMHEVELKRLKPETNYFWKIVSQTTSGKTIESEVYTFKSVVNDSTAFLFALVGDAQINRRTPWAWDSISTQVWQERPHFVVLAGDLVDWGHNKREWVEEFLGPGHDLMSRVPVYSVLGNHEGDADYYYQYMANPKPEYCYTFRYGNADFFMIDTNRDLSEGSDQYNWLEQQLARSNATWKIVVHHHPPYSSESDDHGNTFKGARSTLGHSQARDLPKLFDRFGVDFSLFGHTHVYERTWPLKNNRIHQREGTIYINSGGAGGGLETLAPTRNWFTLEIQEGHHYCTFAIYDKTLLFKAVDHQGRIFDAFQLNKDTDRDEVAIVQPPAPIIDSDRFVFSEQTEVKLEAGLNNLQLYYSLDGSEPSTQSTPYTSPIAIKESTVFKARAFNEQGNASRVVTKSFEKVIAFPPTPLGETQKGLSYKLYTGDWRDKENVFFNKENLAQEGVLNRLNLEPIKVEDEYWAITIDGYFQVPESDTYTFYAFGSRGLSVVIDGQDIMEEEHEQQQVFQLALKAGWHKLEVISFQRKWRKAFGFGFWDELDGRIPIAPFHLKHTSTK